jgi:hypothetical protein
MKVFKRQQKETEDELTTDNQKTVEENIELINKGAMEAVEEQQKLRIEVVNVKVVRSLDDQHLDQQLDVQHHRNLKNWTQGNGVSRKTLIAFHRRVIQRAVPAMCKGNVRKKAGSEKHCKKNTGKQNCISKY